MGIADAMNAVEDALLEQVPEDNGEPVLSGFAVIARLRLPADSPEAAEAQARRLLADAGAPYEDLKLEPQEPDGRWAVDVRFVVVSLDVETAVGGVHRTLVDAGLAVDEAWLSERLP